MRSWIFSAALLLLALYIQETSAQRCFHGGNRYDNGDEWLSRDCTKRYKCKRGDSQEQKYDCPSNSGCKNGQCACDEGWQTKSKDSKDRLKKCERAAPSNNCRRGNFNFNNGDEWLGDGCSKKYECKNGQIRENNYNCPSNSGCRNRRCQCNQGYQVKSKDSKDRLKKCERAAGGDNCKQGNTNYNNKDEWLNGDCSKKYKCDKGAIKEERHNCPSDSGCRNGQCQCNQGWRIKSRDSKGKVKKCERESNKCKYQNREYENGAEWLKSDCSKRVKCRNGEAQENGYNCPANSECRNGQCNCKQGFQEGEKTSQGWVKRCGRSGCQHANKNYENGAEWLQQDCRQKFKCSNGQARQNGYNCPSNAECKNGQCECSSGWQIKSRDSRGWTKKCERSNNKCRFDNKDYNNGAEWLKSDCSKKIKCDDGQMKFENFNCPDNSFCNGEGSCRCQASYQPKDRSSKGILESCKLEINSGSCAHNNRVFENGKGWLKNDCKEKYICNNGNIRTKSHNCPSNADCDNGQCRCRGVYKEKSRDSNGLLKRCEESSDCEYNGKTFENGATFLNAKCDRKMKCKGRKMESRSHRCPSHSSCPVGGQCVCDFGYEVKSKDRDGILRRCREKESMKCNSGFQRIFNRCLSITKNSRVTFSDAQAKCKQKGGKLLVSDNSFGLFEQLKKVRHYKDGEYFIMGDKSLAQEGELENFKPEAKKFVQNMMQRYKCGADVRKQAFKRFGGKAQAGDWNFVSPLKSRCMAIDANGPNLFRCTERKGYICEQVSNENEGEDNVFMTKWYSASNPSNKGERESLDDILKKYNDDYKEKADRLCIKPIAMECRQVGTNKLVSRGNEQGLELKYPCERNKIECRNSDQKRGGANCPDYEVRFKCVKDDQNDCDVEMVKRACENRGKSCINRRTGAVCIKQKKVRDKSSKINTASCFMNGIKHTLHQCKATGDPHYVTLDGFAYDFMGLCSYDFASTCNNYVPTDTYPAFKVSSKNYKHKAGSRATWTNGFALSLGDSKYIFTQGQMFVDDIEVNAIGFEDDQIKITAKACGRSTTLLIETKFCMMLQWDNFHGMSVFVPEHYKNHVCGLCGNFDGNPDNDMRAPGQRVNSDAIQKEFVVASFMKTEQPAVCPMKVIEPEACSTEDVRKFAQAKFCGVFNVNGDSPLVKAIRDSSNDASMEDNMKILKEEFKECINDVCWDPTTDRCHDIDRVISGIHQALGVVTADLDAAWRAFADCENSAETRCADKANMKFYRNLRTGCQNTCNDPEKAANCDDENEEAGCGCEEGFFLDAKMNCVSFDECNKFCDVELENGQRFALNNGDEFVEIPCKKILVCKEGKLEEKALTPCSIHADCIDQGKRCRCHEGFVPQGDECVSDMSCKRGYTAVGEKCYKFVEQQMDWHSAAITCGQDGSVLARYDDLVGEELGSFFAEIPKQYMAARASCRQVYCRRNAQCSFPRGYIGIEAKLKHEDKDKAKCAGKFQLNNDRKSLTVSGECQAKFYVRMIKESKIRLSNAFRVWVAGNLYVVDQGQREGKEKFQIDPPEMLDLGAFGNPEGCFQANLNGDGKLVVSPNSKCDHKKPFICEYDNIGKIPHNPNDFKRLSEKGNYQEAIEMCGKLNRPLAGIYNGDQNSKIRDMLRQLGGDGWVGGTFKDNRFTWSDGNPFKFLSWKEREPNNFRANPGSNEMCVAMDKSSGRWYTEDCSEPLYPICGPPLNMEPASYTKYYKVKGFTSLPELRQKLAREGKPEYVCREPIAIECSTKEVNDGRWRNNFNQQGRAMECTAEKLQCKEGQGLDCSFFRVRVLCPSDENQCETLKSENINPCTGGRTCIPVRNHYMCRCTGENEWDHQKQTCHQSCGHCYASGDPHYTTFHGARYDFMGTCMYKFAGVCELDEFKTGPNFDIYTKNKLCGDRGASCIFYVEVHLRNIVYNQNGNERTGNFVFKISRDQGNTYFLNDREHSIGEFSIPGAFKVIRKNQYFNMISEALSLDVLFSGTKLSLNLPDQFVDKMCGLCGDCTSPKFRMRDGSLKAVAVVGQKLDRNAVIPVANEWIVPFDGSDPELCKAVEPIDDCTTEMENKVKGPDMCGIFKDANSAISDCFDQIDPTPFFNDCVMDACHEEPMISVCGTVRTYAQACMKRKGIIMDWRNGEFCPMDCKDKMYRTDASCEPMCGRDDSVSAICDEDPEEGCVCPAGFMRQGDDCVTPDRCGCKIAIGESQTATIKAGESRILPRCEEIAICEERENGVTEEMRETITMDPYAICVEDPLPRIDCARGYILQEDGRTCKRDPEACSQGYDEKSGMCMSVPDIKKVWRQAVYACNEKDGTLALINTDAKWAEIETIMKEKEIEQMFISGQVKVTIVDDAPVYEPVLESTQKGKIEFYNFDYHSPPVVDIQLTESMDIEQMRGQETILALVARMGASGSAAIVAVPRDTQAVFVCEERYVKPKEEEWYGPCNSDTNMEDNGDQESKQSLKKMKDGCLVCPHPMEVGCIKNPKSTGTVAGECKITKSGLYYSCSQGTDCMDYAVETKCARDIDECAKGLHDCPDRSTCKNTVGAYKCVCDDDVPLMIKGYCHENKVCTMTGPRAEGEYVHIMTGFPQVTGSVLYNCPFKVFETCQAKFDASLGLPVLSISASTEQREGGISQGFSGFIASPGSDGKYKTKHFAVYDSLLREGKFLYGDSRRSMDKHELGFGCQSVRTTFLFVPPNVFVVQHFDKVFKFGITFPMFFGIEVSKEYASMSCGMCTYQPDNADGTIEIPQEDIVYLSGPSRASSGTCSVSIEPTTVPPPTTTPPPPPPPTTTTPPPPTTTVPATPPPSTTPSLPDESGLFTTTPERTTTPEPTTIPQTPPPTPPPTSPPPPTTTPPPPTTTIPATPPPSTTPSLPDESGFFTTTPERTTTPPEPDTTTSPPPETTIPITNPPSTLPTPTTPPPPTSTVPSTSPLPTPMVTTTPPPPPTTPPPTTPPTASPTPVVDYFCEEEMQALCLTLSDLCSYDYFKCQEDLCFTDTNICTYLETALVGECQNGFEMDTVLDALKKECDEHCSGEDMAFYYTGGDAPERCQDSIQDDGESASGMGSFACACDDGYKLSGSQCVPQEECGCNIDNGFYLKKDDFFMDKACSRKAICLGNGEIEEVPMECSIHASCIHTEEGPTCACDKGYFGDADMPNGCQEPDDEDDSKVCYTKTNAYGIPVTKCNCKDGYVSNCTHCVDLDECVENLHDCDLSNEKCENTPGAFECSCALGFEAVDGQCEDIDECQRGLARCGANSGCVNSPGSYDCECCAGFKYNADARDCERDTNSVDILVANPKCCLQCDFPDLCDPRSNTPEPFCVIGAGQNKEYSSYKALFEYYCVNNLPMPRNKVSGECPEVDPTSAPVDPNDPSGGSQTTVPGGEGPTIPSGGEGGNPTSNPEVGATPSESDAQTPPPPESCDDSEFCQKIPPPPPSLDNGPVCGPANQVEKETFPSYCEMVKSVCKKNGGPDSVPNVPVAADAGECPEPTTTTPPPPPTTQSPPPPVSVAPDTSGNTPDPSTGTPAPSETTVRAEPTTPLPPSEPLLSEWTPWGRCRVDNRDLSCGVGRQSRTRSEIPYEDDREVLPVAEDQTYEEKTCFEPCDPEDPDITPEQCPDPGVCGEDDSMVCGTVGVGGPETFMNECELNVEACKAGEKPNVISKGECGEEQEPRQMCNPAGRNIWAKYENEIDGMLCVSEEVNINTCAHLGCEGGYDNCCIPSDYDKIIANMECMDGEGNIVTGTKVFLSAIGCRCSDGADDEAGTPER